MRTQPDSMEESSAIFPIGVRVYLEALLGPREEAVVDMVVVEDWGSLTCTIWTQYPAITVLAQSTEILSDPDILEAVVGLPSLPVVEEAGEEV